MSARLLLLLLAMAAGGVHAQEPQRMPVPEAAPAAGQLRVDHAWVRNAESADARGTQARDMARLRALVVAGGSFVASWESLGLDGTNWHVAEGESYPADVLPPGVAGLPDGAVSAVVPGDGGLHLIRVIAREPAP